MNDVVIKPKSKELAQRHRGRHFQIQYCLSSNSYKIKDLGIGFGAFARLDKPLTLKDNHLISMGESFFIMNLVPNISISGAPNESTQMRLRIKVFAGPANGEIL